MAGSRNSLGLHVPAWRERNVSGLWYQRKPEEGNGCGQEGGGRREGIEGRWYAWLPDSGFGSRRRCLRDVSVKPALTN